MSAPKVTPLERLLSDLDKPLAGRVRRLVTLSGIAGDQAQGYVAERILWHLAKGPKPTRPPAALRGTEMADWARRVAERRAWDLVESHHQHLPPIAYETEVKE